MIGGRRTGGRRRAPPRNRPCPFLGEGSRKPDYKDLDTLGRYLSERGKITPRRLNGVSRQGQRLLAQAVKRARLLALLPYEIR